MPGLITHYICGEAVLEKLDGDIAQIIREHHQMYNVGTQGPDIFFYYLPGLILKKIAGLGTKMHKGNFKLFMKHMAESTNGMEGRVREAAVAYIAGYLTHYCLDYMTHPYIYYKTGERKDDDIKTLKYSVYHRNFEAAIDILMLKLSSGEKPADKKLWEIIKIPRDDAKAVSQIIGKSVLEAYETEITSKQVYKSFVYMMRLTRLMQSRNGKRKRLMEFVEGMTIGEKICSSLIHAQELHDGIDYLNLGKRPWHMPWDNQKAYDVSFTEMFEKAVDQGAGVVTAFHRYIQGEMDMDELLAVTGNYSLSTGLEFGREVIFQYHDIVYG